VSAPTVVPAAGVAAVTPRRRAISNSASAATTETFNDPIRPRIGIRITKSVPFLTISRTPRPSEPTTRTGRRVVSKS
jgi:hypothetical protein